MYDLCIPLREKQKKQTNLVKNKQSKLIIFKLLGYSRGNSRKMFFIVVKSLL